MKNSVLLIVKKVLELLKVEKGSRKMDKIDAPPTDKESSKIKFETQVKSGYDVYILKT